VNVENRKFIIGAAIGLVAGAATAVLVAPATGQDTRKRIREATGQAKQKATEITAKGRDLVQTKRSQIQVAIEAGKRAAEEKRVELEAELRRETRPTAAR